jgi:hypothetical protein
VAENVVTDTALGTVSYLFDRDGLPLEGMSWSGDSGGPAFITKNGITFIAGVNSAGECCEYGSRDSYSRLSIKQDWIAASIEADATQPWEFPLIDGTPSCDALMEDDNTALIVGVVVGGLVVGALVVGVAIRIRRRRNGDSSKESVAAMFVEPNQQLPYDGEEEGVPRVPARGNAAANHVQPADNVRRS